MLSSKYIRNSFLNSETSEMIGIAGSGCCDILGRVECNAISLECLSRSIEVHARENTVRRQAGSLLKL